MKSKKKKILALAMSFVVLAVAIAVPVLARTIPTVKSDKKDATQQWDFQEAGYKNSLDYLMARDGFLYGCDYDWSMSNNDSPNSLGNNYILNRSATWNSYIGYTDLYNIKALGFNATNYWLLIDNQGIVFDDDGYAIALDKDFEKNLINLLDICREVGLHIIPTLQPHGNADNAGHGNDKESPNEVWNKYFKYMWQDDAREAYITNIIDPICKIIADYQDIVITVGLTVENSPGCLNDMDMGYYQYSSGTTWEKYASFVNDLSASVKKYMPTMPTSTEEAGGDEKQYRYNDLNVDLIGQNHYHSGGVVNPFSAGYAARPGYIGEYNLGEQEGVDFSGEYWGKIKQKFIGSAKEGGWMGAFFYSYSTGGPSFNMMKGLSTEYESFYNWAVGFRYLIDDYLNEYHNITPDVDTPVLLANKGGKDVYWISGRSISNYKLERSDDNGKTWKTVAENLDMDKYSLDNGLIKYTDETVSAGMKYCYRVTGYNEAGKSATSKPNNAMDFFAPANIVKDGGFESGELNSLSAWQNEPGAGCGNISGDDFNHGKYSFKTDKKNGIGAKEYGQIGQNVKVSPNTTYVVRFSANVETAELPMGGEPAFVRIQDAKGNMSVHYIGKSDGWSENKFTFSTTNQESVKLQICNGTTTDFRAYFDDFTITELR